MALLGIAEIFAHATAGTAQVALEEHAKQATKLAHAHRLVLSRCSYVAGLHPQHTKEVTSYTHPLELSTSRMAIATAKDLDKKGNTTTSTR